MTDPNPLPPVLPVGVAEPLFSARNILAIILVALFAATVLLPYFQRVPDGAATNLILTSGEIVKAILLLVVGYFFGTSQGSARKDEVIAAQAAAGGGAQVSAPGATTQNINVTATAEGQS